MEHNETVRQFRLAANRFAERKMWERFTNFDCFGVTIPGRDDLMVACVMGDAGEEYGLSLFKGPDAVSAFHDLLDSAHPGGNPTSRLDMLGFSMEFFRDLSLDVQALYRGAGITAMIRTIPEPCDDPPLRVPRGEMLRELGLTDGSRP